MTVTPRLLVMTSRLLRANALAVCLLLVIAALETLPRRFAGVVCLEGALAAGIVALEYGALSGICHRTLVEMSPTAEALPAAAAAIGLLASVLFSILDVAGRLPASLLDPRGGPVLLYASSATILVVGRISRWTRRVPRAETRWPRGSPRGLWVALAGGIALAVGMTLPSSVVQGSPSFLVLAAMAILAGASIEGVLATRRGSAVDKVYFEKSGVLTAGNPEVTGAFSLRPDLPPEELLHLAAAAEYGIQHPIRGAILRSSKSQPRTVPLLKGVEYLPARGIRAQYRGKEILIGNLRLFREVRWSQEALFTLEKKLQELAGDGDSVLFVGMGGRPAGAICYQDPLRPEARDLVRQLAAMRVRMGVLSGDAGISVRKQLAPLGSLEIHADILPHEEAQVLAKDLADGRVVAVARRSERGNTPEELAVTICRLDGHDAKVHAARLSQLGIIVSETHAFARAQTARSLLVGVYHIIFWPLTAGAFEPWLGLSPSPGLAAALAAFLPNLLAFAFDRTESYTNGRLRGT